jgi:uncharacterized membrane protein
MKAPLSHSFSQLLQHRDGLKFEDKFNLQSSSKSSSSSSSSGGGGGSSNLTIC